MHCGTEPEELDPLQFVEPVHIVPKIPPNMRAGASLRPSGKNAKRFLTIFRQLSPQHPRSCPLPSLGTLMYCRCLSRTRLRRSCTHTSTAFSTRAIKPGVAGPRMATAFHAIFASAPRALAFALRLLSQLAVPTLLRRALLSSLPSMMHVARPHHRHGARRASSPRAVATLSKSPIRTRN